MRQPRVEAPAAHLVAGHEGGLSLARPHRLDVSWFTCRGHGSGQAWTRRGHVCSGAADRTTRAGEPTTTMLGARLW
jgi:hypothetical protein